MSAMDQAFGKVLNYDLLKFDHAGKNEPAILTIQYHTSTDGDLYVLTTTNRFGLRAPTGLVRRYKINWTINLAPPGTTSPLVHKVESHPGQSLRYREGRGDPEWAIYAIVMYSAFHDFSNGLISSFGLEPPKPPTVYSYGQTIRRK